MMSFVIYAVIIYVVFKDFNINISYHTRKTVGNFLNPHKSRNNPNEESGVI
jgi:hypothetical protein